MEGNVDATTVPKPSTPHPLPVDPDNPADMPNEACCSYFSSFSIQSVLHIVSCDCQVALYCSYYCNNTKVQLRLRYLLRYNSGDKNALFRQSVHHNENRGITRGWQKLFDEVHGDGVPWALGDWELFEQAVRLVAGGFGVGAGGRTCSP